MRGISVLFMAIFAMSPLFAMQTPDATTTGNPPPGNEMSTLRIALVSCPPGEPLFQGEEECTEVIEDDGTATVTAPGGEPVPLIDFERDESGNYVIDTPPGVVVVDGLASDSRAMTSDGNLTTEDSAEWFIIDGADVHGQVTYADERGPTPFPMPFPGRESGTINLHMMVCPEGIPQDGVTGCEAVEDDGQVTIRSADSIVRLTDFERNDAGAYVVDGGQEHPRLEINPEQLQSTSGNEVHYQSDGENEEGWAYWNVVEGHERDVFIYYVPAGEAVTGDNWPDGELGTTAVMHDPNLPPAEPVQDSPSMGGPNSEGEVRVHLLSCDEGVAPSLENCTASLENVDEFSVTIRDNEAVPLNSFEQAEDGAWLVQGGDGEALLSGIEPVRTDAGITNGAVVDDSTISFVVHSGNTYDLYVIYYFD